MFVPLLCERWPCGKFRSLRRATVSHHRSFRRRIVSLLRRASVWLALVNYSAMALGLPLPVSAVSGAASGEAHPCRDHRCGCVSAEQCWKACCCYSHDEKLSWARRNGVTVPSYVIAEPEVRPASNRSPVRKSCCAPTPAIAQPKSCCSSTHASVAHDEVTCEAPTAVQAGAEKQAGTDEQPSGWVSYLNAARCRGVATTAWLSVPISLPVKPTTGASAFEILLSGQVCIVTQTLSSVSFPPALPPPRIV
jgi:hypothetical protein